MDLYAALLDGTLLKTVGYSERHMTAFLVSVYASLGTFLGGLLVLLIVWILGIKQGRNDPRLNQLIGAMQGIYILMILHRIK